MLYFIKIGGLGFQKTQTFHVNGFNLTWVKKKRHIKTLKPKLLVIY